MPNEVRHLTIETEKQYFVAQTDGSATYPYKRSPTVRYQPRPSEGMMPGPG